MPAASVQSVRSPAAQPVQTRPERWRELFAALIAREGDRFTDDAADRGGATKYGVTLRTLAQCCKLEPGLLHDFDVNNDGEITTLDIRDMTLAQAETFYFTEFYKKSAIYALPAPFDGAVLDQAVNDGLAAAVRLLQEAYGELLKPPAKSAALGLPPIAVDGQLGAATIAAVAKAVEAGLSQALLLSLRTLVAHRYVSIVAADPSQRRFLAGWLTRAEALGDV